MPKANEKSLRTINREKGLDVHGAPLANYPAQCAPGFFEAVTISPKGRYVRTFHDLHRYAKKRLAGVSRHKIVGIFDHTPRKV